MPSRQDQLHSYQFTIQRVVAALVMRETDPAQSPFRRAAGTLLAGVLVAAIALGGVGVYGLLVGGGGTGWRNSSAVIVERESGARYVYRDEKLHPVLNYASALLIVGSASPKTVLVSRKSIEGVPRGVPLGIAEAPDSLPAAGRLVGAPWTLCSAASTDGADPGPRSALLVGQPPGGGQALGDRGVLVRDPSGRLLLVWHNRRHPVLDEKVVLKALGWLGTQPVPAAPALLNGLEVGGPLGPIEIDGLGGKFEPLAGAKVGEVFKVESQGGRQQFVVAERGGLAGITQVQADILLGDPDTNRLVGQREPTRLKQGDFARIAQVTTRIPAGPTAPPATTPELADAAAGALCALVRDDTGVAEVRVGVAPPDVRAGVRTGARTAEGAILADYVVVEPGRGAVVEAAAAPGATGGALAVVTDLGRRYALASPEVLSVLGYAGVRPLRLPANLLAMLPAGRALDPAAANAPAMQG